MRKCGNGLAFVDTDKEFKFEICEEYQFVECGDRTELEPPISAPNCPRLYGTFPDPEDCGYFWKCRNGAGTRLIGNFVQFFLKLINPIADSNVLLGWLMTRRLTNAPGSVTCPSVTSAPSM